jgi:2-dehydro-3-deoxyphosphogluconate aldolase/(4S)-4-hydroxy-2-oxoglutarate aldolase
VVQVTDVVDRLAEIAVVPVVVLERAEDARQLGEALKAGGLPCAEVTLRTPAAEDVIRELARDPDIVLGAGTVLTADQADRAVDAGARFIVSPGFSQSVVRRCAERGVPVFPGVATPTEIQSALAAGLNVVKFFPAETLGGVRALRAMSAPFGDVRFMPTGGVSASNLGEYLAVPSVVAVGGSWMVASQLVRDGRFDEVTRLSEEAVAIVHARAATS